MPKSILDKNFKYVPSTSTDLRKTFARIRREMKLPEPAPKAVVLPIVRKK